MTLEEALEKSKPAFELNQKVNKMFELARKKNELEVKKEEEKTKI